MKARYWLNILSLSVEPGGTLSAAPATGFIMVKQNLNRKGASMLEKNYIIKQFEDTLSPKFMRRQKYLRKIESRFIEMNRYKKRKLSRSHYLY